MLSRENVIGARASSVEPLLPRQRRKHRRRQRVAKTMKGRGTTAQSRVEELGSTVIARSTRPPRVLNLSWTDSMRGRILRSFVLKPVIYDHPFNPLEQEVWKAAGTWYSDSLLAQVAATNGPTGCDA